MPERRSANRFDVRKDTAPTAKTLERPAAALSAPPDKEQPGIEDRPVLPRLAHALKKRPAGETRLANGTIKVVTLSGTVYCLQPLPEAVVLFSSITPPVVPTNCP